MATPVFRAASTNSAESPKLSQLKLTTPCVKGSDDVCDGKNK